MPSISKLKDESYYIEPPFSYRPSVAEYLTTFKVTINGIIADIMHLDKKGNLNIENYLDDGLQIVLKDESDLNDNELFLWNFLKSRVSDGKIKFSDLKKIERAYEKGVIANTAGKFGSKIGFNPGRQSGGFVLFGFLVSVLWSLASSFLSVFLGIFFGVFFLIALNSQNTVLQAVMVIFVYLFYLGFPLAIIFFLSNQKLNRSPLEMKFLFKEILLELAKLLLLMCGLGIALSFAFILAIVSLQFTFSLIIIVPAYIALMIFYYRWLGRIAYKFFYWLLETEESSKNRLKWLSFKQFILNQSAIREKPLKHYELWDSFYYYSLAVGAIKNPF